MNTQTNRLQWLIQLFVASTVVLAAASSLADEVVADDLIVDGSVCVGDGCVENMEFGFSTLQLQGETLRLRLDGTGSNDWEIVANGASNGNYFGLAQGTGNTRTVVFRIKAGAPENSLLVTSGGRLGVGIRVPKRVLHVKGSAEISKTLYVRDVKLTSSRNAKHDIENLSSADALASIIGLQPVSYRLETDPDEPTLGFIAEEVPDLLASPGRVTIEPMKLVAALTGAAQAQGEAIEQRRRATAELEARLERLEQALLVRSGRVAR